ncbi:FABP family protein [Corynebacterium sp. TAE3-ERU12]|uniref:FABP family protein n=1 Tax=Corynebacterium sp. TAE3-ERU12 TaxID=2849491 RepID=UPI001C4930EA|nr:FABP family protein [Corynebacterium sp. TAE3-ERU12]MBV7295853.1 FABP family protein [Corynebacterium sp. TAE3-ERU12]
MTTPSNGNEAIDRAAEQAKQTSGRNIADFSDLPVPGDTANLREGPNIHDGLLALLPLVGVWRGEGKANGGADEDYEIGMQAVFSHDGENYLRYETRTWRLDNNEPVGREVGFWRISEDDEIEVVCAHSEGATEIFYGKPISERAWEMSSASTMVTASGPSTLGAGKRLYGLMPNNDLGWVDERMQGENYVPLLSVQLSRWAG